MRFGAVTGLEAEARIARQAGWRALASGGIAAQTRAAAEGLLGEDVDVLVSFGIAGALAPELEPGMVLLPRAVVTETGARHRVDAALHDRVAAALRRAGLSAAEGDLLGADAAAASAAQKSALHRATGAIAVDLESHHVAIAANAAARPFLVLRAIADHAAQALPPAAVNGLDASGRPALMRVLLAVARRPSQIPALLRLAGQTRQALAALRAALAATHLGEEGL